MVQQLLKRRRFPHLNQALAMVVAGNYGNGGNGNNGDNNHDSKIITRKKVVYLVTPPNYSSYFNLSHRYLLRYTLTGNNDDKGSDMTKSS